MFQSKVFFEKWNDNKKAKKNSGKCELGRTVGTAKWDRLGQVEVVGTGGTGTGDLQIRWDRLGLGQGSLQIRWDRMGLGGSSS